MAESVKLTLSLWLILLSHLVSTEQILHSVSGDVGRGNYTYYSLMYDGPITLYLHSKVGDADLYVSQIVNKPTFEPDSYCLQSSTCGLDAVHIPPSFQRPVGIGVYGHISHEVSSYTLEVYYREEDEDDFDSYTAEIQEKQSGLKEKGQRQEEYSREARNKARDDDESESFVWTLIWSFFDIMVEVVFL